MSNKNKRQRYVIHRNQYRFARSGFSPIFSNAYLHWTNKAENKLICSVQKYWSHKKFCAKINIGNYSSLKHNECSQRILGVKFIYKLKKNTGLLKFIQADNSSSGKFLLSYWWIGHYLLDVARNYIYQGRIQFSSLLGE